MAALSASAQPRTSFTPGILWNDTEGNRINAHGGGIYHENGTYYWFGEKRNRGVSGGVNVYSSTDLYNWKFERLALERDSTNPLIRPGGIMERPKVIRNPQTGKYLLWFHLEVAGAGYDSAYVGIAESDSVTGPYTFVTGYRPNGNMSRDHNLFVDDDGTAYHIYSSRDNYDLRLHTLTDDWRGAAPKDSMLFSLHREAPALFKYRNKYHLITSGATGWNANPAELHVADSIWGPWVSQGNPAKGSGAHITFSSQSSYVLPVPGYTDAFIYMGDRWTPNGPDGVEGSFYVWLPLRVQGDSVSITWTSEWTIEGVFGEPVAVRYRIVPREPSASGRPGVRRFGPSFEHRAWIESGGVLRDVTGRRRAESRPALPAGRP